MNRYTVKIVVDSSADLLGLDSVSFASAPLKIVVGAEEFVDDASLDVEAMADLLRGYSGKSSTACPAPGDWITAFGDAEHIFCVTISGGISGTYNAACIAARDYETEHPGCHVFVIDSLSVGGEMQLIVDKLVSCIEADMSFEETCAAVTAYQKKTGLIFMLESMRNLANNGRVSHIVAKAAGLLGIRMVGRASDKGELELLDKCRGEKRALAAIAHEMKQMGFCGGRVKIGHVGNPTAAVALQNLLRAEFGKAAEVEIYHCRGLTSFYAEKNGMIVGFECHGRD